MSDQSNDSDELEAACYEYHFGIPSFFTAWDSDAGPSDIRWITIKDVRGLQDILVGLFCMHNRNSYLFPTSIMRKWFKSAQECGFDCPECNQREAWEIATQVSDKPSKVEAVRLGGATAGRQE
jgi:hypothetical protein